MVLRRRGPRGPGGHDLFPGFTDVYEIGVGSLAVVFRAREIGTHRHVALKLMNVRDASPRSIESFERESIALGALSSHPNIVTLYRTLRTPDGRPVLVLELCSGAVADRLRDGAGLPVREVVSMGVKIAGALETAHRGGILHRDVKPQNILVTEFGEPALADFGVAMLQSSTQTTAGLFDFTTLHAAPELLEGGGTSAATDVYELASSLYQLIAGQSAFRAYAGESPASVILRILRDPVRPLSAVEVPMALSDLLIRAMSKDKEERPPSAAEFAAELAEVEIAQYWNRTQFLIRGPGLLDTRSSPAITAEPAAAHWSAPPVAPTGGWTPAAVPLPPPPPASVRRPSQPPHPDTGDDRCPAAPPLDEPVVPPTGRRAEVESDDEYLLAAAPDRPPEAADRAAAEIAPPAVGAAAGADAGGVPVWAVRSAPATQPHFVSDLSLDPMSLRRRATLRTGASSIRVDEHRLRLRTWFKRTEVAWSDVYGFEANLDPADGAAANTGHIVALTSDGAVELPGTRRPLSELSYVHALLDAYRIRAQRIANQ